MAYSFPTVNFSLAGGQAITNPTGMGMPSTFPCVLFSAWLTVPDGSHSWFFGGSGTRGIDLSFFNVSANLALKDSANLTIALASPSVTWTPGTFVNVLFSADGPNNRMQLYINDVAQSVVPFWVSHNQIGNDAGWVFNSNGTSPLCAGDVWMANQASFTDLTVTANRRKFINADLSPVNLGPSGALPFGASPPVFLHVATGGVAADFTANAGTGGAYSPDLIFGACGTFPAFTRSAAVGDLWFSDVPAFVDLSDVATRRKFVTAVGATQDLGPSGANPFGTQPPVFLTRYEGAAPNTFAANAGNGGAFAITGGDLTEANSAPPCAFEGAGSPWAADAPIVWLRWSDDRGRTWSSPIPQSIGATGAYLTQVQWNRTGMARDRIFEVFGTVPGRMAVNGAWLDPEPIKLKS